MVLIRQNKGAIIILHAKSPTFRAAKLKDFTVCSGNNFVFNAFLHLEPVQRLENMARLGLPGSCNSMSKSILDVLKVI